MRRFARIAALLLTGVISTTALSQSLPIRGPLGIDRLLVGTVSRSKAPKKPTKNAPKPAAYELKSAEGEKFMLHGHEAELKKLCGKKVRLTGTAVGNEVTVSSVEISND